MRSTTFSSAYQSEISFPLGGIGAGCIGLAGNGRLIDWEIINRPSKGSMNGNSHFAIKAMEDGNLIDARVIHGDVTTGLTGGGSGLSAATMAGFPHFRHCTFTGEFPIATIDFADEGFPGAVQLTAWSPLIPLNDKDSSLPTAFFTYAVTNTTDRPLTYAVSTSMRNPYDSSVNEYRQDGTHHALFLHQTKFAPDSPEYGDLTIACDTDGEVSYQQYWYRGSWNDGLERYWRNFIENEAYENRTYDAPGRNDMANLSVQKTAQPGETITFRFVLTWSRPNCYNYWSRYTKKNEAGEDVDVTWKNYYATLFSDSYGTAQYALANWDALWQGTKGYHDALFAATLPEEVIEAISATTSVLKSPTVLRLENGEFYGWEGVWGNSGSCEGTCTHVWNYAYALCFLFPSLERSIRETDFTYNQDENGRMSFRMTLPLGRERGGFRACVDGQMGGVIKTYREWKLSGDDAWLAKWWPAVKKSIEYAWSEKNPDRWDADRDGVLEGRQHHTLDVELFGPSSWLEGFYLAALLCGVEMAERMGENDTAADYRALYAKGKKWCDENLFNGKWYTQKIDLKDRSIVDAFGAESYWNDESGQIKYQIGEGCIIDQCLAQWHANLCGVGGDIYDKDQLHTALRSLYQYNFLPDMRSHYNTFRLFAVNDEAGTIICSWPEGTPTPAIPIPYAQESMHGFEYALAGLMISEGMIDEGVEIVKAIRARYRGNNRNPWNEIECGNNYARSMAAFALLPIFTGYQFNMPEKTLGFAPILEGDYRSLWFTSDAWGIYEKTATETKLTVVSGTLELNKLSLPYLTEVKNVFADGQAVKYVFAEGKLDMHVTANEAIVVVGK